MDPTNYLYGPASLLTGRREPLSWWAGIRCGTPSFRLPSSWALALEGEFLDVREGQGWGVALAWLLQRLSNILLIPGTSSAAHLQQNIAAARLMLPTDALAELDALTAL